MLALPDPPTLEACPRVERVDDAPPEEVKSNRWSGQEDRPCRCGNLCRARRGLAEEQPEAGSGGTKLCCRRQREGALQRVRQQEDTIKGWTALQVGQVHGLQLVLQRARPVRKHVCDRHVVGDGEGEVQVGEAVTAAQSERAYGGTGHD